MVNSPLDIKQTLTGNKQSLPYLKKSVIPKSTEAGHGEDHIIFLICYIYIIIIWYNKVENKNDIALPSFRCDCSIIKIILILR